jgi:hypothetical protein
LFISLTRVKETNQRKHDLLTQIIEPIKTGREPQISAGFCLNEKEAAGASPRPAA